MKYHFGYDDFAFRQKHEKIPVIWDSHDVVNGHVLITGKSGTGKTHMIRSMISHGVKTATSPVTFHVMDVHGDIDIPGCSSVQFSEATTYGLNPLKINADVNFGGVRKRIQSFLSTLDRTQSRALGPKQEAVLRNIVLDLYAANGFYIDKPESWRLNDGVQRRFAKKYPNIDDAHRFAYSKLTQMFLGTGTDAIKNLEDVNRKTTVLASRLKRLNGAKTTEIEDIEKDIEKAIDLANNSYSQYLNNIKTGRELDGLLKYDSKDVLKSVVDRLENMKATGLFKNQPPPFDTQNPVWRYNICALSEEEKRMFVEFCLQDLFAQAVQRGPVDDIRDVIVIDEAHLFFRDDEDNILNTLAKEARKFGVSLVCASQSPTHFSDDFISNVATKIILGIDQMYWDGTIRKMRIDPKILGYLVPQRTIAAQINNKDTSKSAFKQIYVGRT